MRSVKTWLATLAIVVATPAAVLWAQPQDSNFTQTNYATGVGSITDLAWASDGTNRYLFFTQQGGAIRVVRNDALQGTAVTTVSPIVSGGERGLLGIAIDPAFSSNRRIYIYVTETSLIHRIYRYTTTDSGGTVGVTGGRMQMGIDLPSMDVNHDGGALAFGPDGNLYFGVGNMGNGNNVGGWNEADEYTSLGSKIGRMTAAGTPLTTNPWYTGAGGARDYMWSRGYRNPFGIAFGPSTGTNNPWILEVGDSWEHIFIASSGSNRGWVNGNDSAYTTDTSLLYPRLRYQRNTTGLNWTSGGGCLTRGCFYTGTTFPAAYQGNLFFCENNGAGKLVRVVPNGTGTIPNGNVSLFVDNVGGIVDVEVGPDGALYYASRGASAVYRLQYTAATPQNIVLSTSTLSVNEGSTGTFTVRLAAAPTSNVTVTVAATGDASVSAGPGSLTFTPSNWNMTQTVTVTAGEDVDTTNDGATITCSSPGLTSRTVAVTAVDNDPVNGAPTATITQPLNGAVVSGSTAEFYGDGTDPQGSGTLVRAEFRIDGNLIYTDNTAGGHYHLGGGHNMWDTTTLSDGPHTLQMTVFDNGGLNGSHQITVIVNNSGSLAFEQDPGSQGIVSMEAENYSSNVARGGHTWTPTTAFAGYSGAAAVEAAPNDNLANINTGYAATSPELTFAVNFVRTGTHYVWVRGWGPDPSSDSVHAGLDGAETPTATRIGSFPASWTWMRMTMDGTDATVDVATTGTHVVNVWMREDGFVIDKVVLTTDAAYTPSGTGPAESPMAPPVGGPGGGGGGGDGGCGVTGTEPLVLLGLLALRRRRKI